MKLRRKSAFGLALLLIAACSAQQSSTPVLQTRFAVGAGSSFQDSVDLGEVPAGYHMLEVTSSTTVELGVTVRTPSWYVVQHSWDALHRPGSCEELETGEQRCTAILQHAAIPAGRWDVFVKNQSDVDADFTVRIVETGPGWGLAGGIMTVIVLMFAGFLLWWRQGHPGEITGQAASMDPSESRERLDLLKTVPRWGDIPTTTEGYPKPRPRR